MRAWRYSLKVSPSAAEREAERRLGSMKPAVNSKQAPLPGTSSAPTRLVLEGPRLWLSSALLLVLIIAPWAYFMLAGRGHAGVAASPRLNRARGTFPGVASDSEGPWGRVEALDIVIAPPLEFVDAMTADRASTHWHFPDTSMEQLTQFIGQLPLRDSTRRQILGLAKLDQAHGGVTVAPTDDLLWDLTPEERAPLYHALGLHPSNLVQVNAFRFKGELEQWLYGSGVSHETLELARRLLYRHGQSIFLADIQAILPRIAKREQTRLVKALSGDRTLVLKLRVMEEDNIAELVEYWGRGRRNKDVRPILESLAKVRGGGVIDVAHLLPSFSRTRIYTYPVPAGPGDSGSQQHCHWTAMNFFSSTPDNRFGDVKVVTEELKSNYHPIYRNPALGDVVVFLDRGVMFHSAIYVADDILFTKNGATSSQPWMYMRMEQMIEFYPRPFTVEVQYYRRNDL